MHMKIRQQTRKDGWKTETDQTNAGEIHGINSERWERIKGKKKKSQTTYANARRLSPPNSPDNFCLSPELRKPGGNE